MALASSATPDPLALMTESPSRCDLFESPLNFKPPFPLPFTATTGEPPAAYVGADVPSTIVRSRIAGRLCRSLIVPWTEKSIVVGSERLLAALIALRRDPRPESFRLDTVTVASRCAGDVTVASRCAGDVTVASRCAGDARAPV